MNNTSSVAELPDHIVVALNRLKACEDPALKNLISSVKRVQHLHIIPYIQNKKPANINREASTSEFCPFKGFESECNKCRGALLLAVRRCAVQSKDQEHVIAWNLLHNQPKDETLIHSTYLTRTGPVHGHLIPLLGKNQVNPEWVYLASPDQLNPDNLELLVSEVKSMPINSGRSATQSPSSAVSSSRESSSATESTPLVQLDDISMLYSTVYRQGFYSNPSAVKFVSEASTMLKDDLFGTIIVPLELFFVFI